MCSHHYISKDISMENLSVVTTNRTENLAKKKKTEQRNNQIIYGLNETKPHLQCPTFNLQHLQLIHPRYVRITFNFAPGRAGLYCRSQGSSCCFALHLCCFAATTEVHVYLLHGGKERNEHNKRLVCILVNIYLFSSEKYWRDEIENLPE